MQRSRYTLRRLLAAIAAIFTLASAPAAASAAPQSRWFSTHTRLDRTVDVSAEEFEAYFKDKSQDNMAGFGATFVEVGRKLNINAVYIMAHAAVESGWGASRLAREKHNFFGYGAYDSSPWRSAYRFDNARQGIEFVMYMVRRDYLQTDGRYHDGGPTLTGMNRYYASDPEWKVKIRQVMNGFLRWLREKRGDPRLRADQLAGDAPFTDDEWAQEYGLPWDYPHLDVGVELLGAAGDGATVRAHAGERLEYRITVRNTGRAAVRGAQIGISADNRRIRMGDYSLFDELAPGRVLPSPPELKDRNRHPRRLGSAFPLFLGDIRPGEARVIYVKALAQRNLRDAGKELQAWPGIPGGLGSLTPDPDIITVQELPAPVPDDAGKHAATARPGRPERKQDVAVSTR